MIVSSLSRPSASAVRYRTSSRMESWICACSSSKAGGRCQVRENPAAWRSMSASLTTICRSSTPTIEPPRPKIANSTPPSSRKCNSGSRSSRASTERPSAFRRVPDRRGGAALLCDHRHLFRHLDAEVLGVVGRPPRSRDLNHACIVEGSQGRVEVGIGPHRDQLGVADRIGPGGARHVDRIADRRQLALRIGLALLSVTPGYVVDLLLQSSAFVLPALDDLDAVEIGADRILQCGHQEAWRLARWRRGKIATHRYAAAIADGSRITGLRIVRAGVEGV